MQNKSNEKSHWTFLTNHAHVLLCLVREEAMRMRDIAAEVGITERAVQLIIADLEEAGYLQRSREGRRNIYQIHTHLNLRHPVEQHKHVEDLVKLIFD